MVIFHSYVSLPEGIVVVGQAGNHTYFQFHGKYLWMFIAANLKLHILQDVKQSAFRCNKQV